MDFYHFGESQGKEMIDKTIRQCYFITNKKERCDTDILSMV